MKLNKLKVGVMATVVVLTLGLSGCTQANKVSTNISTEADNFNVIRRLSVVSAITNEPVFELIGAFSFTVSDKRITAVVETGLGQYKKHSVGLGELTFWVVEDLEGSVVDKYRYEVNFMPKSIVPVTFTAND